MIDLKWGSMHYDIHCREVGKEISEIGEVPVMEYKLTRLGILIIITFILAGCNRSDTDIQPTIGSTGEDVMSSVTITATEKSLEHSAGEEVTKELTTNETVTEKFTTEETITEEIRAEKPATKEGKAEEKLKLIPYPEIEADPKYDSGFSVTLEAEDAFFTGNLKVVNEKPGYSGTGYLAGMQDDSDTVTFLVTVPGSGAYDLNFVSAGDKGYKENAVYVDGENIGVSVVEQDDFQASVLERVYLTAGEHEITMKKSWGWILLDSLIVTASGPADKSIYEVTAELVDKKASDGTRRLMKYLADMYGKYIISGQYGDMGILGPEFVAIHKATGKYPAILGLDFIDYTPSCVVNGSVGYDVEYAKRFHMEGGIVTFCWHWNAPEPYLINSGSVPWWRGFYTEGTTIDLKKIMDGEDKEGYELLLRDMDAIAVQLKLLEKMDIPILWRPLHEASGGWFWWGASGPEAYIKLYQLLFDRLTNYHDIHNLIWVWNGQGEEWYPGDAYVDIVGIDIYPGERVYTSQAAKFNELVQWNGSSRKIIAMTENGCMFDPELAVRDNAMWSYFGVWEGDFITLNKTYTLSEKYTETSMLKKVYSSDIVITLDELPDLKTYDD